MKYQRTRHIPSAYLKYFHHLISQMIGHLDRNATGFWFVKRTGCVAVECVLCFPVDLGFEGFIWISIICLSQTSPSQTSPLHNASF